MSDETKVIYLADVRERIDRPGTPCPLFPNEAIEVCGDADPSGEPYAGECENAPLCRAAMLGRDAIAAAPSPVGSDTATGGAAPRDEGGE